MSYILEALKKAQAERQLGNAPTIHAPAPSYAAPRAGQGAQRRYLALGVGVVVVAVAVALLWPRLRSRDAAAIAVVCAVATVVVIPFVPPGIPILVAAVVAAVFGWFGSDRGSDGEGLEPDIAPYPADGIRPRGDRPTPPEATS